MKVVDGELYLSPQEASAQLQISYKTLQRWADAGERWIWVRGNGHREKQRLPVQLDVRYTPTGYRLYGQSSVLRLREQFERDHQPAEAETAAA